MLFKNLSIFNCQNFALPVLLMWFTHFASLLLHFGELCGLGVSGGLSLRPPVGRRERVLVLGAAGGVGSLAAQMAAQAGAQVVAVGGTASQGELKEGLGAAWPLRWPPRPALRW